MESRVTCSETNYYSNNWRFALSALGSFPPSEFTTLPICHYRTLEVFFIQSSLAIGCFVCLQIAKDKRGDMHIPPLNGYVISLLQPSRPLISLPRPSSSAASL